MSEDDKSVSVYGDTLREAIEAIPKEILDMSEEKLTAYLNPSFKLYMIKRAFWEEMLASQESGTSMTAIRIFEGRVAKSYFYREILKNHHIMAWITQPLMEYEDKTKVLLDKAVERYDELISIDIKISRRTQDKDEDGKWIYVDDVDPKKALIVLQAIKSLEDRVKGASVQRQVSIHTKEPNGPGLRESSLNMSKIDERLEELEQQLGERNADNRTDGIRRTPDKIQPGAEGYIEGESRRVGALKK